MTQPPPRVAPVRDRFYARTFALVTCAVLGVALFKIVEPFLGPLLWAIFIAFLLYPLHVRVVAKLRARSKSASQWSALLLTVLTFIVVIGPLTALSAAFAAQVGDLLQTVQSTVADQTKGNVLESRECSLGKTGAGVARRHLRYRSGAGAELVHSGHSGVIANAGVAGRPRVHGCGRHRGRFRADGVHAVLFHSRRR